MRSTFHGLEIAKRALYAQQSALSTTGHNIANANTEGYTRQRAELQATRPIPYPAMNNSIAPGQIGTGVEVAELERLREYFLDLQFRGENKHYGYWEAKAETYIKIESVMNEPSETGLQHVMDQFWQAWQDLANAPEEGSAARAVVRQRGLAVAETFQYINQSLDELQQDLDGVIQTKVSEINSMATQIATLNDQIQKLVPHGYQPNDLYDRRDLLLDKLSKLVDVEITQAERGMVNVTVNGQELVTGTQTQVMEANPNAGMNGLVNVTLGGGDLELQSGELLGLIESRGTMVNGEFTGIIPKIRERMNDLAATFTEKLNEVHLQGMNADDIAARKEFEENGGEEPTLDRIPFYIDKNWYEANKDQYTLTDDAFKEIDPTTIPSPQDAGSIMVNPLIMESLDKIAAGRPEEMTDEELLEYGSTYEGDGRNANAIASLKFEMFEMPNGESSTLDGFYQSTIAQLGVDSQEAQRLKENTDSLVAQVDRNRQSISGVSLDEEMSNMIKFQHAYNAAARAVTVVDEMLNKVINGMGRVGL